MDKETNKLLSHNLAMRECFPSFTARKLEQASKILFDWTQAILLECNLDAKKHFFAGSGDSGSDVKKVMEDHFASSMKEWCFSHLMNRALLDAFGADIDKSKSKNPEARAIIDRARKTIETLNKSETILSAVQESQVRLVGRAKKLKNSPHHRWSSS